MFYVSNLVRSSPTVDRQHSFVPYLCGWISPRVPWLIITYVDANGPSVADGQDPTQDLIVSPQDLALVLLELSPSICSGVFVNPSHSQTSGPVWSCSPIAELWLCDDESTPVILIVTTTGERHLESKGRPDIKCDLKRVFLISSDSPTGIK